MEPGGVHTGPNSCQIGPHPSVQRLGLALMAIYASELFCEHPPPFRAGIGFVRLMEENGSRNRLQRELRGLPLQPHHGSAGCPAVSNNQRMSARTELNRCAAYG